MVFKDRHEAGKKLARALQYYQGREDVVVVALPRGGVAVAYEVALALKAPLEVFITRKIGVPGDPELAAGAITENGDIFVDPCKVEDFAIHPLYLERAIAKRMKEIAHLQQVCRGGKPRRVLKDHIVIVVDDGIATGATLLTTLKALREEGVKKLVVAVPVAPLGVLDELKGAAEEVLVLAKPFPFYAVGAAYQQFDQLSDEEVSSYFQSPLVGAGRG
jgi:putative phosphoribosyl transferase